MRTAAVAGATGLVGGCVLRRLLDDPEVSRVVAPTRRPLPPHPKLENPLITTAWPALAALDEAYGCLGTTRKDAGGARRFGLVSSAGADAGSSFLYPRTKGEAEKLGEAALALVAPLLVGPLRKYRAIAGDAVAAALIASTRAGIPGTLTLESDALAAH
ncbi:MAG: hypothetical protein HYX59_08575 [Elusimicrobia bacterium]|nr:hypothetical protein [Elusimicrobiota bacterium]